MDPVVIAIIVGAIGLIFAGFLAFNVLKKSEGSERIKEISAAIKEGAMAFLTREYRILAIFAVVVAVVLGLIPALGWWVSLAFIFGAICSAGAGFIGMNIAVRANCRTAAAAQNSLNDGLKVSFRAGGVMGMCVVGIGMVGVCILYFAFHNHPDFLSIWPTNNNSYETFLRNCANICHINNSS